MLRLAVIGDPISHSLSPEIHGEILQKLCVSAEYSAVNVKRGQLAWWVEHVLKEGVCGFNVTMPHKIDIMEFLSGIDDEARAYGAVNTVRVVDDKLYGFNTDGRGFIMSMLERGITLSGKRVTVAGTGGAAITLAKASKAGGAISVVTLGRRELSGLSEIAPQTDIFINATPLGMYNCDEWKDLSFISMLPDDSAVFDSIYNPLKTSLLLTAEKHGLKAVNGLGMLVYQAILADEIFIKD